MNNLSRRKTDKFVVNSVTVETIDPPKTKEELFENLRNAETPNEVVHALDALDQLNEAR
jgi:hypothetical protein